jgi:hypothetical protein
MCVEQKKRLGLTTNIPVLDKEFIGLVWVLVRLNAGPLHVISCPLGNMIDLVKNKKEV